MPAPAFRAHHAAHESEGRRTPPAAQRGADPADFEAISDRVIEEILQRENIASTGIGNGIALPHPQSSTALKLPASVLALAFMEHPVDFGASDGIPVHALFVILSRDTGQHLRLLAHLGRALQQAEALDALARRLPAEEILAVFRRAETAQHTR